MCRGKIKTYLINTDPVFPHLSDTDKPETGPLRNSVLYRARNAAQFDKVQNDQMQLLPWCLAIYTVDTAISGRSEFSNNRKKLFLEGADHK